MSQHQSTWPEAALLAPLIREAQSGAPDAIDRVLVILRPAALAYFSARLPRELAEDSTQSALLRVTGALPRIDPERADAYVATVARNILRTALARRTIEGRRRAPLDLDHIPEHRESVDARVEYEELVRIVHRLIAAKLPDVLAETVHALLRGYSALEIAEQHGVSPVTVRTRLMRARAILREELRPHLDPSYVALPAPQSRQHRISAGQGQTVQASTCPPSRADAPIKSSSRATG